MSTIKANTIQPLSDSTSVVVRTNAQDSLTVDSSGNITVRNEAVIDGINIGLGSAGIASNLRIGASTFASTHTTSANNIAIGVSSQNSLVGGLRNVAMGNNSLNLLTNANDNTAIGYDTGKTITTGSGNILIGSGADTNSGTITNSIAIGHNASAATSNSVYLGNASTTSLYMGNGGGVVAPLYGARAWVNFNGLGTSGTNQTIRASGNVSSVYKTNTGLYVINFATPMPHANYCTVITTSEMQNGNHAPIHNYGVAYNGSPNQTTTSIAIRTSFDNETAYFSGNTHTICVVVFA